MKKIGILALIFAILFGIFTPIYAEEPNSEPASESFSELLKDYGTEVSDLQTSEFELDLSDYESDLQTVKTDEGLKDDVYSAWVYAGEKKYILYKNAFDYFGKPISIRLDFEVANDADAVNPTGRTAIAILTDDKNYRKNSVDMRLKSYGVNITATVTFLDKDGNNFPFTGLFGFQDPDYADYMFDNSSRREIYYKDVKGTEEATGKKLSGNLYITQNGAFPKTKVNGNNYDEGKLYVKLNAESSFSFVHGGNKWGVRDMLNIPFIYTLKGVPFNIVYENLQGATNDNPDSYEAGDDFGINDPGTVAGLEFVGWQEGDKINPWDTGDKVFTAIWKQSEPEQAATGSVRVQYINIDTKEIIKENVEFSNVEVGNPYGIAYLNTIDKDNVSYNFVEIAEDSAPTQGEIVEGELVVKLLYRQKEACEFVLKTRYLDENGKQIIPDEEGFLPEKEIPGYQFDWTFVPGVIPENCEGVFERVTVHRYITLNVTRYLDVETDEPILSPKEGKHETPEEIENYIFVGTDTDEKENITHYYRKLHTHFIDEQNEKIAPDAEGIVERIDIANYKWINSRDEDNGDKTHVYHKVTTSWVDEKGEKIVQSKPGEHPKETFPNYEFVKTETKTNGDVVHHYHKLVNLKFVVDGKTVKEDKIKRGADGVAPEVLPKNGYKFVGWDKEFKNIQVDTVVTAKLELIKYPITYVLDGGKNDDSNPSSYTIEDAVTLKNPIKLGAKFLGWKEGNAIAKGSTGAKTFTAQWEVVKAPVNTGAGEKAILAASLLIIATSLLTFTKKKK